MNNSNHNHEYAHGDKRKKNMDAVRGRHKDWRTWVVVLLMLLAMAVYLLTMDEATGPNGEPEIALPSSVEIPSE